MKTILATNFNSLNEHIINNVPQVEVMAHDIQTQNEALECIKGYKNIETILISDLLRGDKSLSEFLDLVIEYKEPETKVYYIAHEYEPELLKTIARHNIRYFQKGSQSLQEFIETIVHYDDKGRKIIFKEKIKIEKETIDRIIPVGFKKLILTIWDNEEFGCELAYVAAKLTGHSVIVIDLDLLAPKADIMLNVQKYSTNVKTQGIFSDSGLNILLDAIEKNVYVPELLYEASVQRKDLKNLYVLTGNYQLNNYEYYSASCLKQLIEKAYQNFEITILLVNRCIYDEYTFVGLSQSDFNIIPLRADLDQVREFNNYLVFLKNKQQIPTDKSKFVAYEYQNDINVDSKLMSEITEHNYIGSIRYSKARAKYRNLRAAYVNRMEKEICNDYIDIMSQLNMVAKRTLVDKIQEQIATSLKIIKHKMKRLAKRERRKHNADN